MKELAGEIPTSLPGTTGRLMMFLPSEICLLFAMHIRCSLEAHSLLLMRLIGCNLCGLQKLLNNAAQNSHKALSI
ncbi:hypothetical protein [Paenibacillus sp. PK3_47]|uniref:hypothetical protein n=1 Tax=Paenibacillus sp. PK3_47 TaxID=2072642 RepID=UPI00201DAED2|nr:hypothetical protein [Paenibacillus sp. PK3_47]